MDGKTKERGNQDDLRLAVHYSNYKRLLVTVNLSAIAGRERCSTGILWWKMKVYHHRSTPRIYSHGYCLQQYRPDRSSEHPPVKFDVNLGKIPWVGSKYALNHSAGDVKCLRLALIIPLQRGITPTGDAVSPYNFESPGCGIAEEVLTKLT